MCSNSLFYFLLKSHCKCSWMWFFKFLAKYFLRYVIILWFISKGKRKRMKMIFPTDEMFDSSHFIFLDLSPIVTSVNWLKWKANTRKNTWLVSQTLGAASAGLTGYGILTVFFYHSMLALEFWATTLFYKTIVCIYFCLCWVFTAERAFSSCGEQGLFSRCGVWASHWLASGCWAGALRTRAQQVRLLGSTVVLTHGLGCCL